MLKNQKIKGSTLQNKVQDGLIGATSDCFFLRCFQLGYILKLVEQILFFGLYMIV